jgi:hypothetical protein
MNTARIKEIQQETAYPESVSVQQALLKVWNETEQEQLRIDAVIGSFTMQDLMLYYQDKEGLDFTSKVVDVLNCMVNDR